MPRLQDLTFRQHKPGSLGSFAQRIEFLGRRFFVHAIEEFSAFLVERFGGGDIGQHHELLDHAMRIDDRGRACSLLRGGDVHLST